MTSGASHFTLSTPIFFSKFRDVAVAVPRSPILAISSPFDPRVNCKCENENFAVGYVNKNIQTRLGSLGPCE